MSRLISNALVGYAFLNAAWRWLEGRQLPLRVDGRIRAWAYGDGRRDDSRNLERALSRGPLFLPPATFGIRRPVRLR
jgi:hypothetical protein